MAQLTDETVDSIFAHCGESLAAVAESLSQCFDQKWSLELGESTAWEAEVSEGVLTEPGVIVWLRVDDQWLVMAIPASLPLPEWYTSPSMSQKSRLDTLAMEWSMNLLPPDFEAGEFQTTTSNRLCATLNQAGPAEWAPVQELRLAGADPTGSAGRMFLVWPFAKSVPSEVPVSGTSDANEGETPAAATSAALTASGADSAASPPKPASAAGPAASGPYVRPHSSPQQTVSAPAIAGKSELPSSAKRLTGLKVQLSVRLAEKRISLQQLVSLSQGALIPFNKSCEELLELYINNCRFGRGEAVKVGENFGLKINLISPKPPRRDSPVIG